jgi:uncharacterized protein (TIGR02246 family)
MSVSSDVLAKDEVGVRKAIEGVISAWADNDARAFSDRYTEDASIITAEGLYWKGREPICSVMTMLYAGPLKGSKVFNNPEEIRFINDTAAVAVCRYGILLGGLTELPPEEKRLSTWALSKHDGEWLVAAWQGVIITAPTTEAG